MSELVITILSSILSSLIVGIFTFHLTKRKDRRKYDTLINQEIEDLKLMTKQIISPEEITLHFEHLENKIEIMLEASFVTNGYGKLFRENYLRLIKEKEIEAKI